MVILLLEGFHSLKFIFEILGANRAAVKRSKTNQGIQEFLYFGLYHCYVLALLSMMVGGGLWVFSLIFCMQFSGLGTSLSLDFRFILFDIFLLYLGVTQFETVDVWIVADCVILHRVSVDRAIHLQYGSEEGASRSIVHENYWIYSGR